MENLILNCLRNEVKPALGCTEPVAIALAVAYAAQAIDDGMSIEAIDLIVSTNMLKNALNVGVPRTQRVGLEIAAALGVYSDPQQGLALLKEMGESQVGLAHRFHDEKAIRIHQYVGKERVYIHVRLLAEGVVHEAIIEGRHDRLVYYAVNEEVYFQTDNDLSQTLGYESLFTMKIVDILKTVHQMPAEALHFLMDGYHMNKAMALYGLEKSPGLGLGAALMKEGDGLLHSKDLMQLAMQMTAAASDARMSGANLQVMTSNGSGNNGLTAVLPIVAADMIYDYPEHQVVKALAMSHLINSYIKHAIGRMSSVCACGVASATGSAVGIAYLMGIGLDHVPKIIDTMIANLSGMACDGAKLGCALKLSTATAAAIQSVYLLKHDSYADCKNGIVGHTPEDSIDNLGRLAREGMASADQVMTEILLSKFH